jgi:hypothetical protein
VKVFLQFFSLQEFNYRHQSIEKAFVPSRSAEAAAPSCNVVPRASVKMKIPVIKKAFH